MTQRQVEVRRRDGGTGPAVPPGLPLLVAGILGLCAAGCAAAWEPPGEADGRAGTPADDGLASRAQAVMGGQPSSLPADDAVFYLRGEHGSGAVSECTAVRIGPRTLLTAAHCVDPSFSGSTAMSLWAVNAPRAEDAPAEARLRVAEVRRHPEWRLSEGLDHDVALLLLESAPAQGTPRPWNLAPVNGFQGRPLRAVGYGTSEGGAHGERRSVDLTFKHVETYHLYLGDGSGKGICTGDSGGPSFHRFADGVERIVGVHSFTLSTACVDGADVRVDRYASFLATWLLEKEPPQCGKDMRCVEGCESPDPDCACLHDGACNAACQPLWEDPDCPMDCIPDSVCSEASACPSGDPDCRGPGEPCLSGDQCDSRLCAGDAQHAPYCTHACDDDGDCGAGLFCEQGEGLCRYPQAPEAAPGEACTPRLTYCTGGTSCTGPADGLATCQEACRVHADCGPRSAPGTCVMGQGGLRYCVMGEPRQVLAPQAGNVALPQSSAGCSASARGGGLLLPGALGLLLLALRAPRRGLRRRG